MDLFGTRKRRKARYEEFIRTLESQDDSYMFDAWSDLSMKYEHGESDEYTRLKLDAVEKQLDKRGYVDNMGYVIPPRQYY